MISVGILMVLGGGWFGMDIYVIFIIHLHKNIIEIEIARPETCMNCEDIVY